MIVLRNRAAMKAMPSHSAAVRTRGIAARISLSMLVAGTGDRVDAEHLERGDRDRDDDQREDEDPDGLGERAAGRSRAWFRAEPRPGRCEPCRRCRRCRSSREQPVDVGGDQHRFHQLADDAGDDQADEEDQPGADQPRQEVEDLDRQRG